MVKQIYQVSDANKNGVLSLDEFKQFSLYLLEASEGLCLAEADKTNEEMFENFDRNHDG